MKWERINTDTKILEDKVVNDVLLFNGYNKDVLQKLAPKKIELEFAEEKIKKFSTFLDKFRDSKDLVLVVSDYDGDGDTSGAMMYKFLLHEGINVKQLSLDRQVGFGIHKVTVDQINSKYHNIKGIITTDNGSKSSDIIDYSKKVLGEDLTFIVVDHHDKDDNIENASDIFINPHYDDTITNDKICAAMVVFVLINQYFNYIDKHDTNIPFLSEMLELAAVATYTDVMPVLEENRSALNFLINRIRNNKLTNLGLNTLIDVASYDVSSFSAEDIGFKVGPILNACGRLTSASIPTNLLMTENKEKAIKLATECINTNNIRKQMTKDLKSQIVLKDEKIHFVIFDEAHEGLIGIIAGSTCEKTASPTFVFTKGEGETYKGSGRSIKEYDLIESITEIFNDYPELCIAYGGHPGAVGLSIDSKENLEKFREIINERFATHKQKEVVKRFVDFPVGISLKDILNSLKKLEPYGEKLKKPIYHLEGMINYPKLMGTEHMSFYLNGSVSIKMNWFNHTEDINEFSGRASVYFTLSENVYRGKTYYNGNVIEVDI